MRVGNESKADDILQRGMLAQLAARLRARQGGLGGGDGAGEEEGGPIMIDDNCSVSPFLMSIGVSES